MNKVPFYVLSYNNSDKKQKMTTRLTTEGVSFEFVQPVEHNDPRVIESLDQDTKRIWSITLGHLDMFKKFLESGSESDYGIFCEDDIYIRKGILTCLPEIVSTSKRLSLDIVLLGYLLHYRMETTTKVIYRNEKIPCTYNLPPLKNTFHFYNYPEDLWGAQMYMLSKRAAKLMLEKYSQHNIDNADFILTKDTHSGQLSRALIYPMLAVEEGHTNYTSPAQINFHKECASAQFDPECYH